MYICIYVCIYAYTYNSFKTGWMDEHPDVGESYNWLIKDLTRSHRFKESVALQIQEVNDNPERKRIREAAETKTKRKLQQAASSEVVEFSVRC